MKALSLTQPWASLVMMGAKKLETRSWKSSFRGTLAIHSAKAFPKWAKDLSHTNPFNLALTQAGFTNAKSLPLGMLLGTVSLDDCVSVETFFESLPDKQAFLDSDEYKFGNYEPGRYIWKLSNPVEMFPIDCRGALSVWNVPFEIEREMKPFRNGDAR